MKLAIVGSRNLTDIMIDEFIPKGVTEIISGGAKGVDRLAAEYSKNHSLKLTEFLPEYGLYGRAAPIRRNESIVNYADHILVFWDGASKGSLSVIRYAERQGKPCQVILCPKTPC